jgi:hypothetical protein
MTADGTEFLEQDFSGRRDGLHLFMVQYMAVFFTETAQRRMLGLLVNNETVASLSAQRCL